MMSKDIRIITYSQVLQELESTSQHSHLLLGNGFNVSLGITTDYKSIFEKMIEEDSIYGEIKLKMEKENHDIEKLIGLLKECIERNSDFNRFLESYINNKVKFDFMKSASSIVREEVKKVYQDKNENIHLLFKHFSSYFTLNYDTFLYLILMKFKKSELHPTQALAFKASLLFQQQDLDETQNKIYTEIKKVWQDGKIITQVDNEKILDADLNKLTKSTFESIIKIYSDQNHKKWKPGNIKVVCDKIWKERIRNPMLKVNDGFQGELFQSNSDDECSQNLFFLHGSFHIYKDGENIKKIIQKQDRTVYKRLEEIIHADEEDVICVFANESEDKMNHIQDNQYLNKCLNKLSSLSGNLVILGISLDKNDKHIFNAINNSEICKLFISSSDTGKCETFRRSKEFFPSKEIFLFDYRTISYT